MRQRSKCAEDESRVFYIGASNIVSFLDVLSALQHECVASIVKSERA